MVFSDIHDWNVAELTSSRTVAAIPFAGRYWLIDFMLSNMINSGIHKVGVVTKSNYQTLMDHIGSGKDWDLSRKNGGVNILPPNGEGARDGLFKGRLDALMRSMNFLTSAPYQYVVMCDCDYITNINFQEVIDYHEKTNADITCVYAKSCVDNDLSRHSIIYKVDENSRVKDVLINPDSADGMCDLSANIWVIRHDLLMNLISDCLAHGKTRFTQDVLLAQKDTLRIMGFEYKGYFAHIHNFASYVKHNMEMLDEYKRGDLFYLEDRPVFTKVRDSSPTQYGFETCISNSLIADGCYIEGDVENSILFRGVTVGKGSKIKNCIIMQDSIIQDNVQLEWVVTDKSVAIRSNKKLLSDGSYPMYISKNKII